MLKTGKTNRGFVRLEFEDFNGKSCSIEESSLATESCIWLGHDEMDIIYFVPNGNPPWRPLEVPATTQCNTLMHLNRNQVAELLPVLQHFVETGNLPNYESESQSTKPD